MVIDARKQTAAHGTPPDLLRCEFAAVGYRETALYGLHEDTYLTTFVPPDPQAGPPSPDAIRPCEAGHTSFYGSGSTLSGSRLGTL